MLRVLSIRACLSLALLCLLPACGGLTTFHTVLHPSQTAQDCKSDADWSKAIYCGLDIIPGQACQEDLGPGEILDLKDKPPMVGFYSRYDPGTDPFPCWAWVSTASRAYVNFALNTAIPKIEKVVVAKLTWDPSTKHTGSKKASNLPPHCFKKLYEATGPWKAFATPGNLITDELDQPSLANGVSVQQVIQKWAQVGGSHFGFFFTATDESLPGKENKVCETTLNSLQLEVTYLGKQQTWP